MKTRPTVAALALMCVLLASCKPQENSELNPSQDMQESDWPDSLDAVVAAPESHKIMLENEQVRVLEVVIQPGEKEPMHTHRWPSVMLVDQAARIRYYDSRDKLVFETPEIRPTPASLRPNALEPERLHAVENIDTRPFHAIRVELKK